MAQSRETATQQLTSNIDTSRRVSPLETTIAPNIELSELANDELVEYVYDLQEYVEDSYDAVRRDQHRGRLNLYSIDDDYLEFVSENALNRLESVVEGGRTYMSQLLAMDILSSPIGQAVDERTRPKSFEELTLRPELIGSRPTYPAVDLDSDQVAKMTEFLQEAEARGEIYRAEDFVHEFKSSRRNRDRKSWATTQESVRHFAEQGYLDFDEAMHDKTLLGNLARGNVYSASHRILHLAYSLTEEQIQKEVMPYNFSMIAYGNISMEGSDPDFCDSFMAMKPVDYKEIVEHNLMYAPVRISPSTIGFFQETGHLVSLFNTSEADSSNPDSVHEIELKEIVAKTFPLYSPQEQEKVCELFYQTGCGLNARHLIEQGLSMRLSDYEVDDQLRIVQLLNRASVSQVRAMRQIGSDGVLEVARSLEFGDDFSETILSIAEHATTEQAAQVFEMMREYRHASYEFASMYEAYDQGLAQATEQAMNERLTDMLTVIAKVAESGKVTVDTAPHQNSPDYEYDGRFDVTIHSVDEAVETMTLLRDTLMRRQMIIGDPSTKVSKVVADESERGYQIYRFTHDTYGEALLYVRPEASGRYDKEFEYGNYSGVEASISWIANPTGSHRLASNKDKYGVSVRFDREGRTVDEAPDSDARTPVREHGLLSLDVSSVLGDSRTAGVRIGRMIAAGNILRAEQTGEEASLHHNTNHFDQVVYGSREGFAQLANHVKTMAEALVTTSRARQVGQRAVGKSVASPRQ